MKWPVHAQKRGKASSSLPPLLLTLSLTFSLLAAPTAGDIVNPQAPRRPFKHLKWAKYPFGSHFSRGSLKELLHELNLSPHQPQPTADFSVVDPRKRRFIRLNPLLIDTSAPPGLMTFALAPFANSLDKRAKYSFWRKVQNFFYMIIVKIVQFFVDFLFGAVKDKIAMSFLIDFIISVIVIGLTFLLGPAAGTLLFALASGFSALISNEAIAAMDAKEQGSWVDWNTFEKQWPERVESDMIMFAFGFAGAYVFNGVGKVIGLVMAKPFMKAITAKIGTKIGSLISPVGRGAKYLANGIKSMGRRAIGSSGVKAGEKGLEKSLTREGIVDLVKGTGSQVKTRAVTYTEALPKKITQGIKGLGSKNPGGKASIPVQEMGDGMLMRTSSIGKGAPDNFAMAAKEAERAFSKVRASNPLKDPRVSESMIRAMDGTAPPPGIWKTVWNNIPFKKTIPSAIRAENNYIARKAAYDGLSPLARNTPAGMALKESIFQSEKALGFAMKHDLWLMTRRELYSSLIGNIAFGGVISLIMWGAMESAKKKLTMRDVDPWFVTRCMVYPVKPPATKDGDGGLQWYVSSLPGVTDDSNPVDLKDKVGEMIKNLEKPYPNAIRLDTLEPPKDAQELNSGFQRYSYGNPNSTLALEIMWNKEARQITVGNVYGGSMTLGYLPSKDPSMQDNFDLLFWSKQLDDAFYVKYFPSNDTLLTFDGLDRPVHNFASKDGILLQGQKVPTPPDSSLVEAYQRAVYLEEHTPGPDGVVHYDWASISSVASQISSSSAALGAAPTMDNGKLDVDMNGAHLTMRQADASSTAHPSSSPSGQASPPDAVSSSQAGDASVQPGASAQQSSDNQVEPTATT